MDSVKILVDGIEKNVYGVFYIYDSKYYFIYTEKELAEDNYVVLYMVQVGKETKNTENGVIDTGYMMGIEITNPEEQQKAQASVSYIVDDKKNNTINPKIQYLPINMLSNLKIISKKRFRLLKSIVEEHFNLNFDNDSDNTKANAYSETLETHEQQAQQEQIKNSQIQEETEVKENVSNSNSTLNGGGHGNIIIDYRTKYFEEEEKNQELQLQIDMLTQKINEIKQIIG